jgi:hypothetical protein
MSESGSSPRALGGKAGPRDRGVGSNPIRAEPPVGQGVDTPIQAANRALFAPPSRARKPERVRYSSLVDWPVYPRLRREYADVSADAQCLPVPILDFISASARRCAAVRSRLIIALATVSGKSRQPISGSAQPLALYLFRDFGERFGQPHREHARFMWVALVSTIFRLSDDLADARPLGPLARACLQLRGERIGIVHGTPYDSDARGIPESANV